MKLARYSMRLCLASILSVFSVASLAQVLKEVSPKIIPLQQEQTRWCWAAADAMVMEQGMGWSVEQCLIVSDKTGLPNCCPTTQGVCNEAGTSILGNGYPWQFKVTPNHQTWAQIKGGIDKDLPFQFVWHWIPSGSHVMVGSGYVNVSLANVKWVAINDPDGASFSWIEYSAYVAKDGAYYSGENLYEMQP